MNGWKLHSLILMLLASIGFCQPAYACPFSNGCATLPRANIVISGKIHQSDPSETKDVVSLSDAKFFDTDGKNVHINSMTQKTDCHNYFNKDGGDFLIKYVSGNKFTITFTPQQTTLPSTIDLEAALLVPTPIPFLGTLFLRGKTNGIPLNPRIAVYLQNIDDPPKSPDMNKLYQIEIYDDHCDSEALDIEGNISKNGVPTSIKNARPRSSATAKEASTGNGWEPK